MKKPFPVILILGLLIGSIWNVKAQSPLDFPELYEGIEFDMPKVQEPQIPDYAVSIMDFGAVGDGLVKNTDAIGKAMDHLEEKGGGRLIFPRGIWLTGPIILRSNLNLHLEDGALLLFSRDFDDYPLIKTSFEGLNTVRCISPIYAKGVEDISITGNGVIDGNGDAWRPVKKEKMTQKQWQDLIQSGGVLSDDKKMWFPTKGSLEGFNSSSNFNVPDLIDENKLEAVKDFLRPVMVSIIDSKRILLDGPTFQNSPAWNIHPLMSEDITIRNLTVRNPWYSQNGDGLDLESCKNVVIYSNTFDVGDDAICFKSGKDKDGRERGMPTENVVVKNNTVYHGHGGFVIGSEMSGGIRNVHVSACTFIGTDIGLRFKSTRGRGGVVENIFISNIDMINIPAEAIRFNMSYGGESPILENDQKKTEIVKDPNITEISEETPSFRNISMKNIRVNGSGKAAFFMGLPEMTLQNVSLEDAVFRAESGITAIDTEGLILNHVKVTSAKDPALTVYNGRDLEVKNFSFDDNGMAAVRILGSLSQNILFQRKDFQDLNFQIFKGDGIPEDAIKIQ